MEKKKYVKPSMEVYELNQSTRLLVGSNGGGMAYLHGQPEDEKHLA
ncbi:MAG: hypothetical protein IK075_00175 [Prevotella sp.]|nr:hypothetical protein [Prevotella sp.]